VDEDGLSAPHHCASDAVLIGDRYHQVGSVIRVFRQPAAVRIHAGPSTLAEQCGSYHRLRFTVKSLWPARIRRRHAQTAIGVVQPNDVRIEERPRRPHAHLGQPKRQTGADRASSNNQHVTDIEGPGDAGPEVVLTFI
jgi:hypothetical protein